MLAGVGTVALAPAPAYADATSEITKGMNTAAGKAEGTVASDTALTGTVQKIINVILYIIGILAVVMIIIGGIQYTTSAGDQNAVTKAKNTILYGIVGLVIAVLAYAIVSFVISRLK